jgi:hypothetical protein
MPLPYPEVWGARLPGEDGWVSGERFAGVAVRTGDVVVWYLTKGGEGRIDDPIIERMYSFFRREIIHFRRFENSYEFRENFADAYRHIRHPVERLQRAKPGEPLPTPADLLDGRLTSARIDGVLDEFLLFGPLRDGLFGYGYRLTATSGQVLADKVFVEVFDPPTSIAPRDRDGTARARARYADLGAVALRLNFYPLRDATLLAVDGERRLAIRLDSRFDSPFFAEDGRLMAVDVPVYRAWLADAIAVVQPSGPVTGIDKIKEVERALATRIHEHWRGRK